MAVTSTQIIGMVSVETLSTGLDPGGETDSVELTHNIHTSSADDEQVLDATSTPAASKAWCDRVQLSSGELTLDLTALAGPFGTTVDFTGLRVQRVHIKTAATNSDGVGIKPATVNGYELFGKIGVDFKGLVILEARDEVIMRYNGTVAPLVSETVKDLYLWSIDEDAYVDIHLVAG